MLGLHATPDSFRLNQCPPAASTPAPGSHTSLCNGTRCEDVGLVRVAPGPFRRQVWQQFQPEGFPCRHFQPHGILRFSMGLFTLVTIPVTGRRMWVCTLPLIDVRPIRAPWPPSTSTRTSYHSAPCVATGPFRVRFGRPFLRLSSFTPAVRLRLTTDEH
jgi:hypothetical protein